MAPTSAPCAATPTTPPAARGAISSPATPTPAFRTFGTVPERHSGGAACRGLRGAGLRGARRRHVAAARAAPGQVPPRGRSLGARRAPQRHGALRAVARRATRDRGALLLADRGAQRRQAVEHLLRHAARRRRAGRGARRRPADAGRLAGSYSMTPRRAVWLAL